METLILQLIKDEVTTIHQLEKAVRKFMRGNKNIKTIPKKRDILKVYHEMLSDNKIKCNPALEILLVKRAVRTLSGVTIITVLTKPYPCPGQCIYCPDEKRMPKSYLADEPAAARALKLEFDPYEQVRRRLLTLQKNGHPTDKVELIVKGGSWNAYPLDYQYWFILRCFQACNQDMAVCDEGADCQKLLQQAQTTNETAKHRIIGLTLETRPDMISKHTIQIMRELGCTRMEMGVQTIDDEILKTIKRGHTANDVKKATKLLKQYGFKVDYHLMPQLPGSTPANDLKMMQEIFSNPDYRSDMIKIYPCTVIKNTGLYEMMKAGKYKPYSDRELIDIIKQIKSELPYYVRISRLIRDIPSHHVEAGNKVTNLRQVIQAEMKADGTKCNCLRCREIGHRSLVEQKKHSCHPEHHPCHPERSEGSLSESDSIIKESFTPLRSIQDDKEKERGNSMLFIDEYRASSGREYFLSFEDPKRSTVYAFCRLRIDKTGLFPAFIRELHTYGQLVQIGQTNKKDSQHKGMGKNLIEEAEKICNNLQISQLAVISGIGVRGYYRKLGYELKKGYMVKQLN